MHFERLRALAGTLRFRLTAWNIAVVALIVVPTLAGVREWLHFTLQREFDQVLLEDTLEIQLAVQRFHPNMQPLYEELERKAQGHARHKWFVQFFDDQGQLVWASRNAPEIEFPPLPAKKTAVTTASSFRLVQSPLNRPGSLPLTVRVGSSLESVHDDFALLTRMVVIAGGLILLFAPLGGFWMAGRATQPLAHIIHTTAQLQPSRLDARLPIRRTGDELDQLSQTINGMLDRIAVYIEQKRDFIANAAHELRSPLAAIRGSVEVALTKERSSEEYVQLLADIIEECSGLEALVTQLLLLAERDANAASQAESWVRLDQVVAKSLAMFQGVAEADGINLRATRLEAVEVPGEVSHIRQVVNNLMDNALKFTPAGGSVHVQVAIDSVTNRALLQVSDTGCGIAPPDLPRIFERFYRGDKARQRTSPRRGYGLGLSICQAIVTSYGGTLHAESVLGEGSRFAVSLPSHSGQRS